MTTFYEAIKIFLGSPSKNYSKIRPFLLSKYNLYRRRIAEFLGNDTFSKPYPGHEALLNEINHNDGFYVVCGANDGHMVDPTYYLEKFRNWSGILIEPLPKAAKSCRENRPNSIVIETALVPKSYPSKTIIIYDCNAMSVTDTTIFDKEEWTKSGERAQNIASVKRMVQANTLDSILSSEKIPHIIDLLVIDVEGSEIAVLNGLSLDKYKPNYILIEVHTEKIKGEIESLILDNYSFLSKIGLEDHLYIRKEYAKHES